MLGARSTLKPRIVLSTIAVAGYRSLRDVVVPLHGLDAVTGANGEWQVQSLYRALRLLAPARLAPLIRRRLR